MTEKKPRAPRSIRGPIISAEQIVAARMLAGMAQSELALLIGVSVTAMSNLECGQSRAAGGRAITIAKVFLKRGVVFVGPQAVEIYATLGGKREANGEGVQLIKPDKNLTATLLVE
jgi:transcriptional regulator with XRE-family HTH domain